MTKVGQQLVEDQIRDKTFAAMRHQNDNNMCIDCQKKNPKWASIHLGVHLCIDCAGKHRQYGVIYSFVKSTNLDKWNHKQLLYMQKGSNARALQYFRKCGIINNNNRHIDYKSPVVQKYKSILTQQVQIQLGGEPLKKVQQKTKSNQNISFTDQNNNLFNEEVKVITKQLPQAEQVTNQVKQQKGGKKKKGKKKMGNQINIQDFQSMTFDDGVSKQQKQKIVKSYESSSVTNQSNFKSENESSSPHSHSQPIVVVEKPQPKELSQEQVAKKMQEIKTQKNVKSISSQQFKGQQFDNVQVKQKFNQFSGASSISSSSFNNQPEQNGGNETVQKLKELVSAKGGQIFNKLSSYWSK